MEGVLWRLCDTSVSHLERGRASQRGGAAMQVAPTLRLAFGATEGVVMRRGCREDLGSPPSRTWSEGGGLVTAMGLRDKTVSSPLGYSAGEGQHALLELIHLDKNKNKTVSGRLNDK